jgi:hypothetical protein
MTCFSKLLGLGVGVLLAGGCEPTQQTGPISVTPGSAEYQQRQDQLRSAVGDPGRANQNPVAVGRASFGSDSATSIGVGGIQRTTGTGGTAGTSAGAPVSVNPGTTGIERGPGVGAPR